MRTSHGPRYLWPYLAWDRRSVRRTGLRYDTRSLVALITKVAMAGLHPDTPIPTEIKQHQKSRVLELAFENGERYELTYEFLRVFTPSAEARGHGPGQETLQVGKRDVTILSIEPVGNYAIRPIFSDGHDSGLYSWDILHGLCEHRDELWQAYLDRLQEEGGSRDPAECPPPPPKPAPSCGPRKN